MRNAITDVPGILVGHDTDLQNATGCTVILCPPDGAIAGVDARGPAPGTRETDLLRPGHLVERVHAILLAGGSAFGLDAASGVMKFLEEKNIGYDTRTARIPIVPAAIIYDLAIGSARVRPTAEAGYRACVAASKAVAGGNVGAGTGATVGKILGMQFAMKGGIGTASQKILDDVIVGAIIVVNALGDILDPTSGAILAGARDPNGAGFLDTATVIKQSPARPPTIATNTIIGVIATNAAMTKEQINLVAMMAHDGIARVIRPAHTLYDGDVLFALSAGNREANVMQVGHTAAEVVAEAIVRAVNTCESLDGVLARKDISPQRREGRKDV